MPSSTCFHWLTFTQIQAMWWCRIAYRRPHYGCPLSTSTDPLHLKNPIHEGVSVSPVQLSFDFIEIRVEHERIQWFKGVPKPLWTGFAQGSQDLLLYCANTMSVLLHNRNSKGGLWVLHRQAFLFRKKRSVHYTLAIHVSFYSSKYFKMSLNTGWKRPYWSRGSMLFPSVSCLEHTSEKSRELLPSRYVLQKNEEPIATEHFKRSTQKCFA